MSTTATPMKTSRSRVRNLAVMLIAAALTFCAAIPALAEETVVLLSLIHI